MGRRGPVRGAHIFHEDVAEEAKKVIGKWVYAGTRNSLTSAKNAVRDIETAAIGFYEPAGLFEARYELNDDYDIYTRIAP